MNEHPTVSEQAELVLLDNGAGDWHAVPRTVLEQHRLTPEQQTAFAPLLAGGDADTVGLIDGSTAWQADRVRGGRPGAPVVIYRGVTHVQMPDYSYVPRR